MPGVPSGRDMPYDRDYAGAGAGEYDAAAQDYDQRLQSASHGEEARARELARRIREESEAQLARQTALAQRDVGGAAAMPGGAAALRAGAYQGGQIAQQSATEGEMLEHTEDQAARERMMEMYRLRGEYGMAGQQFAADMYSSYQEKEAYEQRKREEQQAAEAEEMAAYGGMVIGAMGGGAAAGMSGEACKENIRDAGPGAEDELLRGLGTTQQASYASEFRGPTGGESEFDYAFARAHRRRAEGATEFDRAFERAHQRRAEEAAGLSPGPTLQESFDADEEYFSGDPERLSPFSSGRGTRVPNEPTRRELAQASLYAGPEQDEGLESMRMRDLPRAKEPKSAGAAESDYRARLEEEYYRGGHEDFLGNRANRAMLERHVVPQEAVRAMPAEQVAGDVEREAEWQQLNRESYEPPRQQEQDRLMSAMGPYKWEYKQAFQRGLGLPEGDQYGPIIEDFEDTELGQQMVRSTPAGKAIDTPAATRTLLGLTGRLAERDQELQQQLDELERSKWR